MMGMKANVKSQEKKEKAAQSIPLDHTKGSQPDDFFQHTLRSI
jgi:hypothetical protein